MTDQPNAFAALMERMARGDQQAATELFENYHKALLLVIRHRLNQSPQLRALYDSIDFLQEVWQDIFSDPEKLREIATFEGFHKFLAKMAHHKIEKARRKQTAQKRDLHRTRHLSDPEIAATATMLADPQPDPARQTARREEWLRWFASLTPKQQRIASLLRDGLIHQEIATQLRCSVRTVKRIRAKLREMPSPPL